MGLPEIEREMARNALHSAIADADAAETRRNVINQGLLGAVLYAHDKGVPGNEIVAALVETGSGEALRVMLGDLRGPLTDKHHEVLLNLIDAVGGACAPGVGHED